jgi:uncharacterized protein YuzE
MTWPWNCSQKDYKSLKDFCSLVIRANGNKKMQITYNTKTDILYIHLDDRPQAVMNQRVSDDIVLDVGEAEKIVGIEILAASKHLT